MKIGLGVLRFPLRVCLAYSVKCGWSASKIQNHYVSAHSSKMSLKFLNAEEAFLVKCKSARDQASAGLKPERRPGVAGSQFNLPIYEENGNNYQLVNPFSCRLFMNGKTFLQKYSYLYKKIWLLLCQMIVYDAFCNVSFYYK